MTTRHWWTFQDQSGNYFPFPLPVFFTDPSGSVDNVVQPVVQLTAAQIAALTPVPIMPAVSAFSAVATAASSVITNSGVATATIPAVAGKTAYLASFRVYNGASLLAVNNTLSMTGLLGGTLPIPLSQILAGPTQIGDDFPNPGMPASGQNVAISLAVPALLGGAASTLILFGYYV